MYLFNDETNFCPGLIFLFISFIKIFICMYIDSVQVGEIG